MDQVLHQSDRYAVLKIQDFRLALAVRLFDGLATQILMLAISWQIYELTHDALLLGFIGLAAGLPFIGSVLWAGHVVDRREKRGILLAAEAWTLVSAFGLLLLARLHKPPLALMYGLIAWIALCRSFQWTALTTYIQLIVPTELYPKGAAWNTSMWHIATISGPVFGGLLYSRYGGVATYGVIVFCYLIAIFFAAQMNVLPAVTMPQKTSEWEDFLSGIKFVLSKRVILSAMTVDMFGVLFGGVDAVLPVFAALLGVGAAGLGLLRAAPATGALISALFLAHHQPFRRLGAVFLTALAGFGSCMVIFALSKHFWLSLAILMAAGMMDGISMVIRASIYQALTPDHLRGRVSSVNGVFIRSSNQIGAFESGVAAKFMRLVPSVILGGCVTLATVALALWIAPDLQQFHT